jgi:hypothetical protein
MPAEFIQDAYPVPITQQETVKNPHFSRTYKHFQDYKNTQHNHAYIESNSYSLRIQ